MAPKNSKAPKNPTIVDHGNGWKIEYQPETRDYWAYIEERGFIGARRIQAAARSLISEYIAPEAS